MSFSAGAIEATLTLDADPFQAGLDRAKADAEEFEAHTYKATLGFKVESAGLGGLQAEGDAFAAERFTAQADIEGDSSALAGLGKAAEAATADVAKLADAQNAAGDASRTETEGVNLLDDAMSKLNSGTIPDLIDKHGTLAENVQILNRLEQEAAAETNGYGSALSDLKGTLSGLGDSFASTNGDIESLHGALGTAGLDADKFFHSMSQAGLTAGDFSAAAHTADVSLDDFVQGANAAAKAGVSLGDYYDAATANLDTMRGFIDQAKQSLNGFGTEQSDVTQKLKEASTGFTDLASATDGYQVNTENVIRTLERWGLAQRNAGGDLLNTAGDLTKVNQVLKESGVTMDGWSISAAGLRQALTGLADPYHTLDDATNKAKADLAAMEPIVEAQRVGLAATRDAAKAYADGMSAASDADKAAADSIASVDEQTGKLKVGLNDAAAAAGGAGKGIDSLGRSASSAAGGGGAAGGGAAGGMGALLTTVLALGPALVPLAAVAAGVGLGILGAFAAAGAGLGVFALAATGAATTSSNAWQNFAQTSSDALTLFHEQYTSQVTPILNELPQLVTTALGALGPLVVGAAAGLHGAFAGLNADVQSSGFHQFIDYLGGEAPAAIAKGEEAFSLFGAGIAHMLEGAAPLITDVENGVVGLAGAFDRFSQSSAFHSFISYAVSQLPVVGADIKDILGIVGGLVGGLAALAPVGHAVLAALNPILQFVDVLLRASPLLTGLSIGAIAAGVSISKLGGFIKGIDLTGLIGGLRTLGNVLGIDMPTFSAKAEAGLAKAGTSSSKLALDAAAAGQDVAAVGQTLVSTGEKAAGAGEKAAGAGAGALSGASGFAALGESVGELAVPLGIAAVAVGTVATAWYFGAKQGEQFNAQVNRLTHTDYSLPVSSLGQYQHAIDASGASVKQLTAASDQTIQSAVSLRFQGEEGARVWTAQGQAAADLTQHQKDLIAGQTEMGINEQILAERFGFTNTQSEALARSLGVNLSKALSPVAIQEFSNALTGMNTKIGITDAVVAQTAANAGVTIASMQSTIAAGMNATATSFEKSGSILQTFSGSTLPVTGAQIQQFYYQSVAGSQQFVANIQKAIKDGYNPSLINQILQAGPQQAGGLLQGLVSNYSASFKSMVNSGQSSLGAIANQAIEEARLMQVAIHTSSLRIPQEYSSAMQLSQQIMATGGTETVAALTGALGVGAGKVLQIAHDYGIALPTALQSQLQAAAAGGAAQGTSAASGLTGKAALMHQAAVNATNLAALAFAQAGQNQAPKTAGGNMGDNFAAGIRAHSGAAGEAAQAELEAAFLAFLKASQSPVPKQAGANMGDNFAGGIIAHSGGAGQAAQHVSVVASGGFASSVSQTAAAGSQHADWFKNSIFAGAPASGDAADKNSNAAALAFANHYGLSALAGTTHGQQFANAIINQRAQALVAADSNSLYAAQAFRDNLGVSLAAGVSHVEQFAHGITGGEGQAVSAANAASAAAASGLRTGDWFGAGAADMAQFAAGITSAARAAAAAASAAAGQAAVAAAGAAASAGAAAIGAAAASASKALAAAAPHKAMGGIIPATPGGMLIRAGEAGYDELITPLGGPNAPKSIPSVPAMPAYGGAGGTSRSVGPITITISGVDLSNLAGVKAVVQTGVEDGVTKAFAQLEDQVTR